MNSLSSHQIGLNEQRAQKVKYLAANSRRFEKHLPVLDKRDELLQVISEHQVVVVTGETGSGKTTQLPQLCLELDRGSFGLIGHTQPRRISTKAVAQRLADELGVQLGQEVGYHIRFDAKYREDTIIKVMTDGILLSEIRSDNYLNSYDTLLIDEAHERNLNTDFILGYLAKILDKRTDLKVIITSATIDSEKFARHFDAPIVSVSGRSYKVDIEYRPPYFYANESNTLEESTTYQRGKNSTSEDVDLPSTVLAAIRELSDYPKGDILVFLPGERDIRDTASLLKASNLEHREVIPLYSRLSSAEQHKIFAPHASTRIILATNIAETSLTIPNIKYVIDSGLARISRFNHRTKVQRLPIEPISKASADQRAGRCGRTSEGLCIRLYEQQDYESRPQYTEPEVLRTNLASVLLHMTAIGLGDIRAFPFLDQPDEKAIQEGYSTLKEIGAIEDKEGEIAITQLGLSIAEFPMDPRMARMLLEAIELNCLRQIIVIVAFLSIQDPREVPSETEEVAKGYHARFSDNKSDFISIIKLWDYLVELQESLTSNQFRKRCKAEFLNVLRVREWQDVVSQINQICRMMRFRTGNKTAPSYEEIHKAILSGLISHIGSYDPKKRIYKGVKNTSFYLAKSSFVAQKKPKWIVAAGIVETSRAFAYTAADIHLSWVLKIAKEQIQHRYSPYWWDPARGESMLHEKAVLYGLVLFENRLLGLRQVDFNLARSEFIKNALCERVWETECDALADVWHIFSGDVSYYDTESIKIEQEQLAAFYNRLLPKHIASGSQFESWYKQNHIERKTYLTESAKQFLEKYRASISKQGFPSYYSIGKFNFPIVYPDSSTSSVGNMGIQIPIGDLFMLNEGNFSYSIEAYREELVRLIIKAFPKEKRRLLTPIEEVVHGIATYINTLVSKNLLQLDTNIFDLILDYIYDKYSIEAGSNIHFNIPDYMKFRYLVYEGEVLLGEGNSLSDLQRHFIPYFRDSLNIELVRYIDTSEVTTWVWDQIPGSINEKQSIIYPTLSPGYAGVKIVAVESEDLRKILMQYGMRKLLHYEINISTQITDKLFTKLSKKFLLLLNYTEQEFLAETKTALIDHFVGEYGKEIFDKEEYRDLLSETVRFILENYKSFFSCIVSALSVYSELSRRIASMKNSISGKLRLSILDIEFSLSSLVHKGFILCTGYKDMPNLSRYLNGIKRRIDSLSVDPAKDTERVAVMNEISREYLNVMPLSSGSAAWPPCIGESGPKPVDSFSKSFFNAQSVDPDTRALGKSNLKENSTTLPHEEISVTPAYEISMIHIYGRGVLRHPLSELWQIRFLIEELRVSLWAQELGTAQKVSAERIRKKLNALIVSNPF